MQRGCDYDAGCGRRPPVQLRAASEQPRSGGPRGSQSARMLVIASFSVEGEKFEFSVEMFSEPVFCFLFCRSVGMYFR